MDVLARLDRTMQKLSPWARTAVFLLSVVFIGLLDFATGDERSFTIFYLLPVCGASWYLTRRIALLVTLASSLTWIGIDHYSGRPWENPIVPAWNAIFGCGLFLVAWRLLGALRAHIEVERSLARVDSLTGVMNGRAFAEEGRKVFNLSERQGQPFTLLHMDLDNFKTVNDTLGHTEGDRVLKAIADVLLESVRNYDAVARLGGDEFVVLLPATGQHDARTVFTKIRQQLLVTVVRGAWPISFSMGVVTFLQPPATVDRAIQLADQVMYRVKKSGKNGILFEAWSADAPELAERAAAASGQSG